MKAKMNEQQLKVEELDNTLIRNNNILQNGS